MIDPGLVSVIIPSYNGARFVERAILSASNQTYKNIEILLVNDGSTDETGRIADRMSRLDTRVRAIHKENGGLSSARNAGIRASSGEYLMFLDVDDLIIPEKVEIQVQALEADRSRELVYSQYEILFEDTGRIVQTDRGEAPIPFRELLAYRNWFGVMVPLLRRKLVEAVGFFDESLKAGEDYDYWIRCSEFTEFLYVPGVVASYVQHEGQMHKDTGRMDDAQYSILQKHFRQDPRRRSCFLSYFYFEKARYYKGKGDLMKCATSLVRHFASAKSLERARTARELARLL